MTGRRLGGARAVAALTLALAGWTSAACGNSTGQTGTNGGGGFGAWGGASGTSSGGGGAVSGGAGGSGGSASSGCGACDGCCQGSTCVPLDAQSTSACGRAGEACSACDPGFACAVGNCVVDTGQCSPVSCPSGCCVGNTCFQPDAQMWAACGAGGEACGYCQTGAVCAAGACTDEPDDFTAFTVEITEIKVTESDTGGSAWDAFGGLPDPYACFRDATGSIGGCTSTCSDTTTCHPASGVIGPASAPSSFTGATLKSGFTVSVWDEDVASNDLIGSESFVLQHLSASGFYTVSDFGGVVSVTFLLR